MSTYRCMSRPTWMISALQHKSKYKSNSISNFLEKKNQIFGFPWCSTREDLSIDASITNVGLILTKPWWFQLFVKSQISNFKLFWKKFKFSGFHCVVLAKTFPLMHQLLILTKLRGFLFSGCGQTDGRTDRQTDRVLESSYGNMSAHKKFQLKALISG